VQLVITQQTAMFKISGFNGEAGHI